MDRVDLGSDPRGRGVIVSCLWLIIAMVSTLAPLAQATTPTLKFSADTPERAEALAKSDFDAIVAEAQRVAEAPRSTSVVPLPSRWTTLDPTRLVAMMSMPGFVEIPNPARGVLLDQAATWDLLSFRRPSDAAVLWERLWPRAAHADPKAAPNGSEGIGYLPDPTWSVTAKAMSTIFACFPQVAWSSPEDPAVWALRHPVAWQWQNYSGWEGFRRCVPQGAFFEDTRPDKAGLEALTEMIRAKFSAELLADGCSRPGPDSCMLLFQALFSLDQNDQQLPRFLKLMEPSFHLDETIDLPNIATPGQGRELSSTSLQALYGAETEAMRKNLFLTLKLPVLIRYPGAWPVGELGRVVNQATVLTMTLARIEHLNTSRHQIFDRYYSSPWQWIDTTTDASLTDSQRQLGAAYARREACELSDLNTQNTIQSFWQGYVLENIRLGHGDCGRFNELRLAEVYQRAKKGRHAHARSSMDFLQPIADALTKPGPLHELALDAMAETCGKDKNVSASDPWHLCANVRARDTERAAVELQRIAAEKVLQPAVDPLVCEENTVARAADALHYGAGPDFWDASNSTCRLVPFQRARAIVALAHYKGQEQSGAAFVAGDSDYQLDLDIVVMNVVDGAVVLHRHEPGVIPSDAIQFEGLSIDTGRYVLAPGKRAFGIRTAHSAHCYQCAYSDSDLSLYMLNSNRIDPILQVRVGETRNESTPECPDTIIETNTAIDVGPGNSHGLADLLLTTTSRSSPNDEDTPATCMSVDTKTIRARFDGKGYRLPTGAIPERP